ncbi:hypothetical protein [Algivirga pacifica]|uniref:Phage protein n=1 Tax=Algivirga pacifica TaxID=1162670 RepID=A0ABP9DP78_9BACT
MSIAINTMRVGLAYRLTNHGEVFEFEIMEAIGKENFLLKDLNTLEQYTLEDLLRYGEGKDYEIEEIAS